MLKLKHCSSEILSLYGCIQLVTYSLFAIQCRTSYSFDIGSGIKIKKT